MRDGLILFSILFALPVYPQESPQPSLPDSINVLVLDSAFVGETTPAWIVETEAAGGLISEDAADAVTLIPGLQALDFGSLGQFSPLLSHGGSPEQTTVFFDEAELRDPIMGSLSTVNIPMFFIRRLAFSGTRGLSPNGRVGPAGEVVVSPVNFTENQTYSKVFFMAGDWEYSDLGILFGVPLSPKTRLVIAGDRQEFDGFVPNSKHTGSRIFSRLNIEPSSSLQFHYTSILNKNDVKIPAPVLPDLMPFPLRPKRKEKRWDHILGLRLGSLQSRKHEFKARIHITDLRHQTISDSALFDNHSLSFNLNLEEQRRLGQAWLSFGGNILVDAFDSDKLGDASDVVAGFFVRSVLGLSPKLRLNATGQAEKHQDYSVFWNVLMNLEYHFSKDLVLWFGVRQGHRYPSFAERLWPTALFSGNAALEPEKRVSFESGFKSTSESVSIETTLQVNQVNKFIAAILPDSKVKAHGPENLGTRTDLGLNFKFKWQFSSSGEVGFLGSYYHFFNEEPVFRLHIPDYTAYGYLSYGKLFFDQFVFIRARLSGRVFGQREGRMYHTATSFPQVVRLAKDAVMDFKVRFEFSDATLFVSWENLFDRRYRYLPGFFMPPRTLRFGIDWEFFD